MAAMAESGRPSKVQVRTCLTCTNRLSDLCYDTHTLCEKCCNQVCGYNSFCDECRSWSTDFRRMYVKHQRTLHQKRVSKGNAKAKAKSPPVADDSASNVSIESHVSVPVVILPLDSQSVKHQRALHQKRVSKGNAKAKAKSPPVADDSASNVSIESHVSVPVVILPLDSQSVNIDDDLGNIQNIDSVVEIQQPQPEAPPPPGI